VLEGQAFATPVGGEVAAAPITFESEAEKPTRAPAKRRSGDGKTAPVEAATVIEEPEESVLDAQATDASPEPAIEAGTDGGEVAAAPAKKRTRRGSRGGKRRKPVAQADGAAAEGVEASAGEAGPDSAPEDDAATETERPAPRPRKRTPRIHVPDADARPAEEAEEPKPVVDAEPAARNGDSEEPIAEGELAAGEAENGEGATTPRKRTRRGSRGGRNRKRKAPAAATDDETGALATAEPDSADGPGPTEAADAYVPMSEWIDELDE
jgi:ribonuclease E